MSLITAERLTISHGGDPVLRDVDLSLEPGEIVTLVGPNGSGKSTLVRALLGVLRPLSGRVLRRSGLRIGHVPQKLRIDNTLPLGVRRFLSLPKRRTPETTAAALARVGGAGLEDRSLTALSGGQFQRVLLARALLVNPEVLTLNEAARGLDQPGVASFYRLIEELRQGLGCAVPMVSHDPHVIMSACDRVICLNGHVCCEGTPRAVFPAPVYRALFGHGTGAPALYRHDHDHDHDLTTGAEARR